MTTYTDLLPRLKKEQNYTSTPLLGLRGLFYGELYLYHLLSPDVGRDCRPKHVAYMTNKWMSEYLCCYISRVNIQDINLINATGWLYWIWMAYACTLLLLMIIIYQHDGELRQFSQLFTLFNTNLMHSDLLLFLFLLYICMYVCMYYVCCMYVCIYVLFIYLLYCSRKGNVPNITFSLTLLCTTFQECP